MHGLTAFFRVRWPRPSSLAPPLLPLLLTGLVLAVPVGCADDTKKRLADALAFVGATVVVTAASVDATCASGDAVSLPAEELGINALGMAKTKDLQAVAQKIANLCDEKQRAKAKADQETATYTEKAKKLGIDATGKTIDALKAMICQKLDAELPRNDPMRKESIQEHARLYGCKDPGPPAELLTKAWQITKTPAQKGKPAATFLRLDAQDGARLIAKCDKKLDVYVSLSEPLKKKTKDVYVALDGKKPSKWKIVASTDGKAFFLKDGKPNLKTLATAESVKFSYPPTKGKKLVSVSFPVDGLTAAVTELPALCRP